VERRRKKSYGSEGLSVKRRTSSSVGLTTAAARTVLAPLEESGGRAELVARRLGEAIRVGLILDGEKLPPERDLAAQFGVSTVTLRDALTILREQGLVSTSRGRRGGSFAHAPADPAEPLRRFSANDLRDLGDERRAISGAAALLAAQRAVPEEVARLEEQLERLQGASSDSERRRAATELTIAIAAAAQSTRLTHEEARLRSEVGDLLRLGEIDHDALVRDARALVHAIATREPERARELAERHVEWETERLIELRRLAGDRLAAGALSDVAEELEHVLTALDALGAEFAGRLAAGRRRRDALEPLRATTFGLLAAHRELVAGAGVVVAPGLLADAPRWLEWWWTRGAGEPEPLRVNLDPAAPDFYDYTTTDWYETAERTRAPRLAGPYVDYACTNQYAITLSVPVVAASGTFLGVAAADVLVANLERRVAPALAALGRAAALVNADGRVIVSGTPAVAPGERIAVPEDAEKPIRSWLLVDVSPRARSGS
jgi:GntR family transcriptional repressor for pyruvate dehydrogenase complex